MLPLEGIVTAEVTDGSGLQITDADIGSAPTCVLNERARQAGLLTVNSS